VRRLADNAAHLNIRAAAVPVGAEGRTRCRPSRSGNPTLHALFSTLTDYAKTPPSRAPFATSPAGASRVVIIADTDA